MDTPTLLQILTAQTEGLLFLSESESPVLVHLLAAPPVLFGDKNPSWNVESLPRRAVRERGRIPRSTLASARKNPDRKPDRAVGGSRREAKFRRHAGGKIGQRRVDFPYVCDGLDVIETPVLGPGISYI